MPVAAGPAQVGDHRAPADGEEGGGLLADLCHEVRVGASCQPDALHMGEWADEGDAKSRTGGDPKRPAGVLERLSRRVGGLLRLGQLSLAFPQDAGS